MAKQFASQVVKPISDAGKFSDGFIVLFISCRAKLHLYRPRSSKLTRYLLNLAVLVKPLNSMHSEPGVCVISIDT